MLIGVQRNNPQATIMASLSLPSTWMYSLMTIISIKTKRELVMSTTYNLFLKREVTNQNHHLLQDTSTDTATVTKDSLVLAQGRTNQLVLDPLSIPHNDSPPPDHVQQLPTKAAILIHSPMW
jgi:hypothetical protein